MTNSLTHNKQLKKIKLFIADIDGIFNDGRIYFDVNGHEIMKPFHVQDSIGIIELMKNSPVKMAIISGRKSNIAAHRMTTLGIDELHLGFLDKITVFKKIQKKYNLSNEEIAYIGDDLPDLPCIKEAGIGISVPNAVQIVRNAADMITEKQGGHGAIREVCDLLRAQYSE